MAGGEINTSSYQADLEPVGREWFFDMEKQLPELSSRIFEKVTTDKIVHRDQVFGGLGEATLKPEGSSLIYDSMQQGFEKQYRQATYANGFIITREMRDFGQANIVMKNQAPELRKSLYEKKENILADVLNNAFTSTYTGGDGKELCATDHPIQDGLTMANELATAADLAESSLEQMLIELSDNMRDYRGKRSVVNAQFLIVPTELVFEAQRILRNVNRPATADRDINAINSLGFLKEEIMHHHRLTDADAYFLKTDCNKGLRVLQSQAPMFESDNDFDTFNMKFIGHERYGYGWSDYRCVFGTPGAA